MFSHPGSGLQNRVGVHVSPRVTWAWVAVSHLLHPLAPSQELPSVTAACHHLYPRSAQLIVAYSSTNKRPLFPQKSIETYRKPRRISCYGDHVEKSLPDFLITVDIRICLLWKLGHIHGDLSLSLNIHVASTLLFLAHAQAEKCKPRFCIRWCWPGIAPSTLSA